MAFCRVCGKEIEDSSFFCDYCGAPVVPAAPRSGNSQKGQENGKISGKTKAIIAIIIGAIILGAFAVIVIQQVSSEKTIGSAGWGNSWQIGKQEIPEDSSSENDALEQALEMLEGFDSEETEEAVEEAEEEIVEEIVEDVGEESEKEVIVIKPKSEYLLPESHTRKLVAEDLKHLSHEELCFARNEIYARHGWIFSIKEIADFFEGKDWYQGTTLPANFNIGVLSEIEKQNVQFILDYETAHYGGSYY